VTTLPILTLIPSTWTLASLQGASPISAAVESEDVETPKTCLVACFSSSVGLENDHAMEMWKASSTGGLGGGMVKGVGEGLGSSAAVVEGTSSDAAHP